MKLTQDDLEAIKELIDGKLNEKLKPVNEFIAYAKPTLANLVEFADSANKKINDLVEFADFAKTALTSLLDESQEHFEQKLPQRVKKLEDIHLGGHHAS
jgi:hypothetical protein